MKPLRKNTTLTFKIFYMFSVILRIVLICFIYMFLSIFKAPTNEKQFEEYERIAQEVYNKCIVDKETFIEIPYGVEVKTTNTSIEVYSKHKILKSGKVIAKLQNGKLSFTRDREKRIQIPLEILRLIIVFKLIVLLF